MMRLLELSEPLWASGRLHDKVVTVFTDHPQIPAPDAVIFPIYSALYHWGAVVIGLATSSCRVPRRPMRDSSLPATADDGSRAWPERSTRSEPLSRRSSSETLLIRGERRYVAPVGDARAGKRHATPKWRSESCASPSRRYGRGRTLRDGVESGSAARSVVARCQPATWGVDDPLVPLDRERGPTLTFVHGASAPQSRSIPAPLIHPPHGHAFYLRAIGRPYRAARLHDAQVRRPTPLVGLAAYVARGTLVGGFISLAS